MNKIIGLFLLTLFVGCSSSAIRTLSSDGGDVGNSGDGAKPIQVQGLSAQILASALVAGKSGIYVGDPGDQGKDSVTVEKIQCSFHVLAHPTASAVIDRASCKKNNKPISDSLALVLALKAAGIEETSNNGPSAVNPWESHYDIKSISCASLVGLEDAIPACSVIMSPQVGN